MIKNLKNVLFAALVIVGVFFIIVATRADTFSVERSATVNAPPEIAYGLVADFHQWEGWSPWAKLDPQMKTTYTGSGVGGSYAWDGADKVGSGKMTFTELKPNEKVGIKLEFIKPFASTNDTAFRFEPAGTGTKVTWTMSGPMNFVSKAMGIFKSMDAMIGPDFEKGLAAMQPLASAAAAKAAAEAKAAEEARAAEQAAPAGKP